MNTEKKLEYFTEAIAREVESKKRHARRQMTEELNAKVSEGLAQAQAQAAEQVAAEIQALEKANNKRITEAATDARRALAEQRENQLVQLWDQLKTDVMAFTRSPGYESYLIAGAQAAQAGSKHPYQYIQLAPDDMHLSESIQKATGLTPEQGDASQIGGFRLLTANRSKAADFTFQSRLAEARQEFSAHVSKQ